MFAYLKHLADRVEQPTMGVYLLLVLRFHDKDNLHGDQVIRVVALRDDQLRGRVDRKLGRVLEVHLERGVRT